MECLKGYKPTTPSEELESNSNTPLYCFYSLFLSIEIYEKIFQISIRF
jgi:hypothetical protein